MTRADLEQFKAEKESALAECLRGSAWKREEIPDIPAIDSPESLKEQFYWFKLGINNPPVADDIDWEGLEKELTACADEVAKKWHERKKVERKQNATIVLGNASKHREIFRLDGRD